MKFHQIIKRIIDNYHERILINQLRGHLEWFGVAVSEMSDAELKDCAHRAAKVIAKQGVTVEQASKAMYTILEAMNDNTGT